MPTTDGKSVDLKRPAVSSTALDSSGGFAEDRAVFDAASQDAALSDFPGSDSGSRDAARFSDSLALVRSFNLIDSEAARQQVLAFARRLAGE